MGDFIREEVSVFLQAAWYGMFIAIFYDVLRIFRRVVKHHDFIVGIEDYLFWVAVGVAVFSMIFQSNDGVVRGYIFLALLIGAYSYHKSVSSFLVKYISKILNLILTLLLKKPLKWAKIILGKIFRILIKPFKKLALLIKNIFKGEKRHEKHNDKRRQPKTDSRTETERDKKRSGGRRQSGADSRTEVKKHGKHNDKKKKKRKARDIRH